MNEISFPDASPSDIIEAFFRDGYVVLRNFADPAVLTQLKGHLQDVRQESLAHHLVNADLEEWGLPSFDRQIFGPRHHDLVKTLFGPYDFCVHGATASRHIDATGAQAQWMKPLAPHLDAFFHPFQFTVNFWTPLQVCGVHAPGLGVVSAGLDDVVAITGYDGGPPANAGAGAWNLPGFDPLMRDINYDRPEAMAYFHSSLADRIVTPSYQLGDAVMISNWTLHFTHVTNEMTITQRDNVELRFWCDAEIGQVRALHFGAGA